MPEIAFIMGKSASGKDKIYKNLIEDESLKLNTVILYTTRPMRAGETDGVEYFFVNDETAVKMQESGRIVELREYNTVYGVWKYFTADDGQIDLNSGNRYLVIGTLEAYDKFCEFYGKQHIMPIYIEVEDGLRLTRAIASRPIQNTRKCAEDFLQTVRIFQKRILLRLVLQEGLAIMES